MPQKPSFDPFASPLVLPGFQPSARRGPRRPGGRRRGRSAGRATARWSPGAADPCGLRRSAAGGAPGARRASFARPRRRRVRRPAPPGGRSASSPSSIVSPASRAGARLGQRCSISGGSAARRGKARPASGSSCGPSSRCGRRLFCRKRRKSTARPNTRSVARSGRRPLPSTASSRHLEAAGRRLRPCGAGKSTGTRRSPPRRRGRRAPRAGRFLRRAAARDRRSTRCQVRRCEPAGVVGHAVQHEAVEPVARPFVAAAQRLEDHQRLAQLDGALDRAGRARNSTASAAGRSSSRGRSRRPGRGGAALTLPQAQLGDRASGRRGGRRLVGEQQVAFFSSASRAIS